MAGVHGRFLTENQIASILEEIPIDNAQYTDIESEDEDEEVMTSLNDEDQFLIEFLNQIQEEENEETNILLENFRSTVFEEPLRKWKKVEKPTVVSQFDSVEGPVTGFFEDMETPTQFFESYMEAIMEGIIFHSNLYAAQKNKTLNLQKSELLAFIGIKFCMAFHQLPSYRYYWSITEDLAVPVVSKAMSRNRFDLILRFLHVNDISKIPENNKDRLLKNVPYD
ncbi:piggyBac transposable element-derived protein 3-like [Bactrocera dorsalis]|uniref:PiggyBac transposable element-derived protein 3-like n=1 Tax=Bactrocera dorsalis TaxID=27457 RepID=A0ABM3JHL7_BACDO|nr:piggyBac transposable element-derived protein 3-like [Bactrocera dorsalis]